MIYRPGRFWAAAAAVALTFTYGMGRPSGAPVQQAAERPLTIDFYALGADGAPITDLRPEEVAIKISGRQRGIQSLRLVKQGELPSTDPLAQLEPPAPPPFGTNDPAESGRTFVLVIEDESFRVGRERPIRSVINAFLGVLSPKDRVSLWTMPHGGMKVNLTTNHDRVNEAMQLIIGHGPDNETGSEAACRTRNTLEALEHMLSTMAGGEGPTTVVLFTSSMMGPRRDAPVALAPGMCELRTQHFDRVGKMVASARAHLYIVQPEDLVPGGSLANEGIAGAGFTGSTNPLEGMENLAGVTGGTRLAMTRHGDATLVNVARATASYYSAVIDGSSSDIEAALGLDVKVSRPGVEVRSRAMFDVKKPRGSTAQPKSPAEMVRSSDMFVDLQMRATGFASLNSADGQMRIVSVAEPVDPSVKFVAMSTALFDVDGRLAGQFNSSEAELASTPAITAMVVPPGTYRLRVAATDAQGRTGAVDAEVVAEMARAGSLRLSSLVLGVSREGGFQPRLQFRSEPLAIAYLDIFGGKPGSAVAAVLEVSKTLNGPAIAANPLTLEATVDTQRYRGMGSVPIGALPPGDYVARVIIGVEGEPLGRVYRSFRKVAQ
jgi:hypothetical protein